MLQGGHGSFVAHGQQGRHGEGVGEDLCHHNQILVVFPCGPKYDIITVCYN